MSRRTTRSTDMQAGDIVRVARYAHRPTHAKLLNTAMALRFMYEKQDDTAACDAINTLLLNLDYNTELFDHIYETIETILETKEPTDA